MLDYLQLLHEFINRHHGNTVTTHNNDTSIMMQAFLGHYVCMMSPYTALLQPLVGHYTNKGDEVQLLECRTEHLFRVQDE